MPGAKRPGFASWLEGHGTAILVRGTEGCKRGIRNSEERRRAKSEERTRRRNQGTGPPEAGWLPDRVGTGASQRYIKDCGDKRKAKSA
jgi:hypothetical protein